jgi:homocysteine S-methyltransferase
MSKCVRLAAEARSQFCATEWQSIPADGPNSSVPEDPGAVKIALSLGPFGAGLSPAQEFDGYYPPPFGPRRYTRGDDNCNAFPKDDDGRQKEDEATAALTQFHFERLCVFADDEAAWDALDFIAFETVPLVREIRAIRMAMAAFQTRRPSVQSKPWWISFVFPQGKFPETGEGGSNVPVRSVVAAALLRIPTPVGSDPLPIPSALGINCTEVELIPAVLADMEAAMLEFQTQESRPWLVLYPNGGDVYNPISQTWEVKDKPGVWAEKLANIVAKIQVRSGIWSGVVAGGCCRTGPEDIDLLNKQLQLGVQGK